MRDLIYKWLRYSTTSANDCRLGERLDRIYGSLKRIFAADGSQRPWRSEANIRSSKVLAMMEWARGVTGDWLAANWGSGSRYHSISLPPPTMHRDHATSRPGIRSAQPHPGEAAMDWELAGVSLCYRHDPRAARRTRPLMRAAYRRIVYCCSTRQRVAA
jgi:hypothetical protein